MTETEHAQWIRPFWKDKLDEIKVDNMVSALQELNVNGLKNPEAKAIEAQDAVEYCDSEYNNI